MKLNEIDLNKTLMVVHIDFDGTIPIVLNRFFQINYAKEIMTNYGEEFEFNDLSSGLYDTVIYTDFSPNEKARYIIKEKNIKCFIIDHHEAVTEELNDFCKNYDKAEYIFDNEKCGSKLYYEWLLENGYKGNDVSDYIIELVNTYDLYKQNSDLWKESEDCNRLLYVTCSWYILKSDPTNRIEAYKFFINNMLWKMQNANNFFFNQLEQSKINEDIKKENEIFENLVKNAPSEISTRKDSKGNYFAIFNCNSKISAVANRLLKKYPKLAYCMIINDYDKDNPKVSLRSLNFNLLTLNYTSGHELSCGIDSEKAGDMKDFIKKLRNKEIFELGFKE